jgi:hypothetical protein
MTGGQDRAAAVRRLALAAAVRSERVRQVMASTATPRLKAGALQHAGRRLLPRSPALWPGCLIPNPLVSAGDGPLVRLDAILAGRAAVLTAREPGPELEGFCRRHGLVLVRITAAAPGTGAPAPAGAGLAAGWTDIRLAADEPAHGLHMLAASPALTVIVRPDRVIAAVASRSRLPQLPWHVPATVALGSTKTARLPGHPNPAHPFPPAS